MNRKLNLRTAIQPRVAVGAIANRTVHPSAGPGLVAAPTAPTTKAVQPAATMVSAPSVTTASVAILPRLNQAVPRIAAIATTASATRSRIGNRAPVAHLTAAVARQVAVAADHSAVTDSVTTAKIAAAVRGTAPVSCSGVASVAMGCAALPSMVERMRFIQRRIAIRVNHGAPIVPMTATIATLSSATLKFAEVRKATISARLAAATQNARTAMNTVKPGSASPPHIRVSQALGIHMPGAATSAQTGFAAARAGVFQSSSQRGFAEVW